jgi:hypothetical protein
MPAPWTRPADVRLAMRKRWQSGELLAAYASGADWQPRDVPLRGPLARELGEQLGEVRQWAEEWELAGRGPLRIEYKKVGGRHFGSNLVPCRAWIDGYDQAWELLGVRAEVRRFAVLADLTRESCPRLVPWLERRPRKVLELAGQWDQILATVRWIDQRQRPGMYLRQVDVPGVDTKFIERHRGVFTELLTLQLDPGRLDPNAADFEGRFRFRKKPGYVRFRCHGFRGFSEMSVRAEEFTAGPPGIVRAYVLENEITYLAFPLASDAMVILGGGYAVPLLQQLGWLADLDLVYWGDIDTHGFAILDRLRQRFPHVRSMLMDQATLLAHRDHWVTEPSPLAAALDRLDAAEARLHRDLVANVFGPSLRLEQERVSFAAIKQAIAGQTIPAC